MNRKKPKWKISLNPSKNGDVLPLKKIISSNKIKVRLNGLIQAPVVDLRDIKGRRIDKLSIHSALLLAKTNKLDLVELNGSVTPPICLLVDFGHFKYLELNGLIPDKCFKP